MSHEIADAFKESHSVLQRELGNPFIAYDQAGQLLPLGFNGISKDENFSNYTNRTITTDYDVSYLQTNYSVAISGEAENRMRIWKIEGKFIQAQRIATIIHTTSLEAEAQIMMTANGLFAI